MNRKHVTQNQITTLFDAGKGYGALTNLVTFTDSIVARRGNRWWMYAGGFTRTHPEIELFSACLPEGAPLSPTGWEIVPDPGDPTQPAVLAGKPNSYWWDGKGGRHCPAYVKGWDPRQGAWVERIYYAGAAQSYLGPYAIGYLEWDGQQWVDQELPVFTANEYWERGSVYEPNLVYHAGRWKLWYVAGNNQDGYIVQGYAESPDGRTNWSTHQVFFPAEEKVFDFCVIQARDGVEAVFSRLDLSQGIFPRQEGAAPEAGLWWCQAKEPSGRAFDWSEPVQISGPGPWKPSLCYDEDDPNRMFVFYNGAYPNTSGFGIPVHFTLNCLEVDRPE